MLRLLVGLVLLAFTPEQAEPHFRTGKGAQGVAALRLDDHARANALFAAALKGTKDKAERARLVFLLGWTSEALGKWSDAAKHYEASVTGLPLLADYAHHHAAIARYWTRDHARALEHTRAVPASSVLDAENRLMRADILRALGKWEDVVAEYRTYLSTYPSGMRLDEARYKLGEALEKVGRPTEALPEYRRVAIMAPLSSWAPLADARVTVLAGPKRAPLTAAEHIERGMVFFDNMRNTESEAAFTAALATPGITPAEACVAAYHRAQSVFKQRQRDRSAALFDASTEACTAAKHPDLTTKSAYQAGRGWGNAAQYERAIARFRLAERVTPGHSYVDDARMRQAEIWEILERQGDKRAPAQITELLSGLPRLYPAGDMRGEALWRLAFRAWKEKKYADTIRWLDAQIASVPVETNYWAEGQPQYWKGRALEKLGKKEQALAAWEETVRLYPLSYYALLAANRLRESSPERWAATQAMMRAPVPGLGDAPAFRFAPRVEFDSPHFAKGLELVRLGLGRAAHRELARAGFVVPAGRDAVTDPDRIEKLYATAVLYDRAGIQDQSHWILRWHVLDYKRAHPAGANRERWRIAYPLAWWHILEPAAKAQGVPPELQIAFVREESAFDPIRESFANAIGLTQMIIPTAKRFGAGLGFKIDRDNLRIPERNVAVGSRFLGYLWKSFHGHAGLVISGYNAGEGAVWRWLCDRGYWSHDEFVEAIPYDETRGYTKRVLATYFVYAWMADETVPSMPLTIPANAKNKRACR